MPPRQVTLLLPSPFGQFSRGFKNTYNLNTHRLNTIHMVFSRYAATAMYSNTVMFAMLILNAINTILI